MWYLCVVQCDIRGVVVLVFVTGEECSGGFGWSDLQSVLIDPCFEEVQVFLLKCTCFVGIPMCSCDGDVVCV